MSKLEEDNICRLFLLLVQVATDVLKKVFKVVALKGNSFGDYLRNNKHDIFHLHKKILCCQCDSTSYSIKSKNIISSEQMLRLFRSNDIKETSHTKKFGKPRKCICELVPIQNINVESLDITLICLLLKNREKLQPATEHWLDTIKETRNNIVHLSDLKRLSVCKFQSYWKKLEGALCGLAATISPNFETETFGMIYSISKKEIHEKDNIEKFQLITEWYADKMSAKEQLQQERYDKLETAIQSFAENLSVQMERIGETQKKLEAVLGKIYVEMNTSILLSKTVNDINDTSSTKAESEDQNDDKAIEMDSKLAEDKSLLRTIGKKMVPVLLYMETPDHWNNENILKVIHKMTASANIYNEDVHIEWCASDEMKILLEMTKKSLQHDHLLIKEITGILSKLFDKADVDKSKSDKMKLSIQATDISMTEHPHCDNCISLTCNDTHDMIQQSCKFIACINGCKVKLHSCKLNDHKTVCSKEIIPCINAKNGNCTEYFERSNLATHLRFCQSMPKQQQHAGNYLKGETKVTCTEDKYGTVKYPVSTYLLVCPNGCQREILTWEFDEHKKICTNQKVQCINRENGCHEILTRSLMTEHLQVCPANVIQCLRSCGCFIRNDFTSNCKDVDKDTCCEKFGLLRKKCVYQTMGCTFSIRQVVPGKTQTGIEIIDNFNNYPYGKCHHHTEDTEENIIRLQIEEMPMAVLERIIIHLDNESIHNLRKTSKHMERACNTTIEKSDIVYPVWTKSCVSPGSWHVSYYKKGFTNSCKPITWHLNNLDDYYKHIEKCPFRLSIVQEARKEKWRYCVM